MQRKKHRSMLALSAHQAYDNLRIERSLKQQIEENPPGAATLDTGFSLIFAKEHVTSYACPRLYEGVTCAKEQVTPKHRTAPKFVPTPQQVGKAQA